MPSTSSSDRPHPRAPSRPRLPHAPHVASIHRRRYRGGACPVRYSSSSPTDDLRAPSCHLLTNITSRSSRQAAGAYYAPAAYKVYEAESAVTAAETALNALNARIKSVRRDPDPTPSALGQISSILPTEQSLVVPSTVSFQQSNPLTRVVFTPIHPQHTTAVRYRHRARQGDRDQGHG